MGTPAPPVGVTLLDKEVAISVYSMGVGIGIYQASPNLSTGYVVQIGENVDRVEYGNIVVFNGGNFVTQGDDTSWAIVPQNAILLTYQQPEL